MNDRVGVIIDFAHENTSDSFEVILPNSDTLTFAYSELPVAVGRYPGDCVSDYDFLVQDQADPICAKFLNIPSICCRCQILNLSGTVSNCSPRGFFGVTIDFDHLGKNDLFSVSGNGTVYGVYEYSELPITIFPLLGDCVTDYEFLIQDTGDPTCNDVLEIGPICCYCEISNLSVTPLRCHGDTCMDLEIDFDHVGPDSLFIVQNGDSTYRDTFAYADVPLTINCFPYNGMLTDLLIVRDLVDTSCNSKTDFNTLNCDSCMLYGSSSNAVDCDTSFNFFIITEFMVDVPGDSGYCVMIRDSVYGPYSYDTMSRRFGPFEGGCDVQDTVVIFDKIFQRCRDTSYIVSPCCDTCSLFNLVAEAIDCNGDSCLVVNLDFDHDGTSTTFNVYGKLGLIGTYNYNDLPITINCFPIVDVDFEYVQVCDSDNPDCCTEIEFEGLDCSPDCIIENVFAIESSCNGQGDFFAQLSFDHEYTSDSFYVFGNGRSEGPFPYSTSPTTITLGPYPGDCRTNYEFQVIDQEDPLCQDEYQLGRICCDTCEISNITAEAIDCNGDSCLIITVDFDHNGAGNNGFDVYSRLGFFGSYSYNQLPLTIDCYPISGNSFEYLRVCDRDFPGCCEDIEFATLDCQGDTCAISELIVEVVDCTDMDSFYTSIDLTIENPCGESFILLAGLRGWELYYDSLPVVVGPFPGGCDTSLTFQVFDSVCFDCSARFELVNPCCDTSCVITDLSYILNDCDTNGMFSIDIDFNTENASDSFFLRGNGRDIGPIAYSSLPYTLDSLAGDCTTEYILAIVDKEDPDCRLIETVGRVCCGDSCEITELDISPLRCNGDSCIVIEIDFEHSGTSAGGFEVYDRIGLVGFYSYDSLPLVIDCYPISGDDFEYVRICDSAQPDCCASFEFRALDCDSICGISNLRIEETPCDTNDQFYTILAFDTVFVSDSFYVETSVGVFGPYSYDSNPLTLGPFDGDCDTEYTFVVKDAIHVDCADEFNLGTICCGDTCAIFDVAANVLDCDTNDMFFVILEYDHIGTSDSFTIEVNGVTDRTFSYQNNPLTFGPLRGDCSTDYTIALVDNEDESCRQEISLGIICCSDTCEIDDLRARAIRCNGDSCIEITLDFIFTGTSSTFDVFDRDSLVGTYDYTMLPFLTIPCYPISGEDFEYLRVCDSQNKTCCQEVEFEALDCEGTNVIDMRELGWKVFYDIQTDHLNFTSLSSYGFALEYEVLSLTGQVLIDQTQINNSQQLNLGSWNNGVYVVQVIIDNQQYQMKFVKM